MSIIKDGQGRGYAAAVDDLGRIQTNTVVVAHEQHHSVDIQNLFYSTYAVTLADTNEAPLVFYQNDHTARDYEIYDIRLSGTAATTFRIYVNSGYTSGGVSVTSVNANLAVSTQPILTQYEGGASDDLVVSAGTLLLRTVVPANEERRLEFKGSFIIPTNKSFYITAQGSAAAEAYADINFAHNPAGKTG